EKKEIIRKVKSLAKNSRIPIYILIETGNKSIVNSKIQTAEFCRNDWNDIFLIIDSDVYVDRDALDNMINVFRDNKRAAFVSGVSYWNGGKENGKLCKPESILKTADSNGKSVARDKKGNLNGKKWAYISAIHGVYFAMYKEVYFKIGGYNLLFPNHGENVELSVNCWRHGFPLVHSHLIKSQHEADAVASIMRAKKGKTGREKFILSTPTKMFYIYPEEPKEIERFNEIIDRKWIDLLFGNLDKYFIGRTMLRSFAEMISLFAHMRKKLDYYKKKAEKDPFKFMPYAIFDDKASLKKCLKEAEKRIKPIWRKTFL
ncbi:MAG: glycosyltransferase, partial [Nanoarchaeota archaeon]|nr:glycosyltransferase [Nanoarchaeota archaeon]